jgi:ComF family protein
VACNEPLERPTRGAVCEACWAEVEEQTPPPRTVAEGAIAIARAAGRYDCPLRDIIHAFKYEGRRTLSLRLGAMLREAGVDVLSGADCVVPVPLHPWRRFKRGFNQAADLAACLDLPVVHARWRTQATAAQTALAAGARRRNVRGAFALDPEKSVADKTILLVDDVYTSGATVNECSRTLKRGGATDVYVLTLARAV